MTQQIIDLVVFSKNCRQCEVEKKKRKKRECENNAIVIDDNNSDTEEINMTTAFDSRLAVAVPREHLFTSSGVSSVGGRAILVRKYCYY